MNALQRATTLTISILLSFVFFILISIGLYTGTFSVYVALPLTILINVGLWLIGPTLSDFLYQYIYKCRFFTPEEFKKTYPQLDQFITGVCSQYRFKPPKIGFIDDLNPTAFTYGATRNNARIIFTAGILKYLEPDEIEAVFAHELGHIYHYDFALMTIAATLIQILYEFYIILSRTGNKNSSGRKNNPLAFIGLISYIFYLISTYLVLYLSRTRELYADSFAAYVTKSPHSLTQALVKIAYGIVQVEDTTKTKRLLEATRTMGIIDVKNAGFIGSIVYTSSDPKNVAKVMAFDIINPWAKILELSSTHPLTGKRIFALERIASHLGQPKLINFERTIHEMKIDKDKLYHNFFLEAFIYFLPLILPLGGLLLLGVGGAIAFYGIGKLIKTNYRFREGPSYKTTIFNQMISPYASPMKGEPVSLRGMIVGRGVPGFIFSEDMMIQDQTGLAYLDYNSSIGRLGNLFFSIKTIKKLLGQEIEIEGWFLRGIVQKITLRKIYAGEKTIASHPKLWTTVSSIFFIIIGTIIILA